MIRYTSFAAFLFFAVSLIIPSGFSFGAALLMLGGIPLLRAKARPVLTGEDKALIAVLLFYFCVTVIMHLVHGESVKEYDLPLRFLLAVPALLVLIAYPPAPACFWAGLAIGGILAGAYTGWQNLGTSILRAGGHTNPIQYGNISCILGVLCFVGLGWAKDQRRATLWLSFLIVGGIMGLLGSLFTGSRGSWVGLPICLFLLYRCYGVFNRRYVFYSLIALLTSLIVIYAIPRTEIQTRVHAAITEAQDYLKTRNADSSIGTRIEMWRVGVLMIEERPLLGWGKAGLVARETGMIEEHRVDPLMSGNNHVYNEWLDAVAKRGVPGLIALLALYFVPMIIFSRYLRNGALQVQPYALCGAILIINYFGFGFSQVFMAHNTGVMTFAFSLAIIWGMLRESARQSVSRSAGV